MARAELVRTAHIEHWRTVLAALLRRQLEDGDLRDSRDGLPGGNPGRHAAIEEASEPVEADPETIKKLVSETTAGTQ